MNLKRLSDVEGMKVYTEDGLLYGEIRDAIIMNNRVVGWKIESIPGSILQKAMPDIGGVIIQHRFVKAIGDIMIISSMVIPTEEGGEEG